WEHECARSRNVLQNVHQHNGGRESQSSFPESRTFLKFFREEGKISGNRESGLAIEDGAQAQSTSRLLLPSTFSSSGNSCARQPHGSTICHVSECFCTVVQFISFVGSSETVRRPNRRSATPAV